MFSSVSSQEQARVLEPFVLTGNGDLEYPVFTVPTSLQPVFFPKKQIDEIARKTEILDEMLIELFDVIQKDAAVRAFLHVSDFELQLLQQRPECEAPLPFWRIDMNLGPEGGKCVEFNTDAARGRGIAEQLEWDFANTQLFQEFMQQHPEITPPEQVDLMTEIYDRAAEQFERFSGLSANQMKVGVLCWEDYGFMIEIELYRDFWRERGIEADIIDPRSVEYSSGKVTANGKEYNFFSRWVDLDKLIEYQCTPILQAYLDGAISIYPTIASGVVGKKAVFELFVDPAYKALIDPEKWEYVSSLIAWTRRLRPGETELPSGEKSDCVAFTKAHREELVVKASVGTEAKEVVIGADVSQAKWEQQVDNAAQKGTWVVQEYVQWNSQDFLTYDGQQCSTEQRNYDCLPCLTHGTYSSSFTRSAVGNILNFSAGATIAPQYYIQ